MNHEHIFGFKLKLAVPSLLEKGNHPEPDTSEELDLGVTDNNWQISNFD